MRRKSFLFFLLRYRRSLIGTVIFMAFGFGAVSAGLLSPFDPNEQNLPRRLKPPGWMNEEDKIHFLGTDALGRDVLSRIIHGSRISLVVGLASVMASGTIGILPGSRGGFSGRGLIVLL
jgi:peptide/nickel transport system permease protein